MVPEQDYALVGVGFTFTVLASLFVVLRIITRVWVVRSLGGDDGFIVLSMVRHKMLLLHKEASTNAGHH